MFHNLTFVIYDVYCLKINGLREKKTRKMNYGLCLPT